MRSAAVILIYAILGWCMLSCNTTGCVDNQSSIPLAGFYSSSTDQKMSLNTLDIHGIGAPGDSLILSSGTSASEVYLPMRSDHLSVSWCLHYTQEGIDSPELNDTITFKYYSEPYFASEECGAMYRYWISSVENTTHLLDSIVISDSLITNVDLERIKIYFRTYETEDPENPEAE